MAQTLANPNAALPEQRERQLFFWIFIGNALGTGLVGFFDYQSQLTTFWDELGIPCLTLCYLVCGMIYYRRPEYLRWLITVCIVSSNIFQVGVMYYAIHYPSSVSYSGLPHSNIIKASGQACSCVNHHPRQRLCAAGADWSSSFQAERAG